MFLQTNFTVIYSRPQKPQIAQILLLCLSLLMTAIIFYVYQHKLVKVNESQSKNLILKLDRRQEPNFNQKHRKLIKELPSLPLEFLYKNGYRRFKISKSCARLPNVFELDFHNNYWQTYTTRNGKLTMRLYGAYYDKRLLFQRQPVVRLLVMINQKKISQMKNNCQIWFEDTTKPIITTVSSYEPIWPKNWPNITKSYQYYPYMLTCQLPAYKKQAVPKAISLVQQPCEHAGNLLKIYYETARNKTSKATYAICVKGLSYPFSDMSQHLIEWLELMHILGVDKVYLNIFDVHPNVLKVIKYYEKLDFVASRQTSIGNIATALPILQHMLLENDKWNRLLNEAVISHDCYYRNLYAYKYIANLDINEIFIPIDIMTSWQELLNFTYLTQLLTPCKNYTRFCFRNIKPLNNSDNFQETHITLPYWSNLIKDKRKIPTVCNRKCLHSTENSIFMEDDNTTKSHGNLTCEYEFPTNLAQLQHYYIQKNELGEVIVRPNIEKFYTYLKRRTYIVSQGLGLAK